MIGLTKRLTVALVLSLAWVTAASAQDAAFRRQTDVSELVDRLRQELEWIPLKAMRKMRVFSKDGYASLDFQTSRGTVIRKNPGWDLQNLDV